MKRDRHLIQKYLDNELSYKVMKKFEEDLEFDSMLQKELALYLEIDEALSEPDIISFKEHTYSNMPKVEIIRSMR